MSNEKKLNKELILLKYFHDLLSNGITTGVTKRDFTKLLNKIVKSLNLSSFSVIKNVMINDSEFSYIVENADNINKLNTSSVNNGLVLKNIDGKLTAIPTYSLIKDNRIIYKLDPIENVIIKDFACSHKKNDKLCEFNISDAPTDIINIAKKISAYYVNDLIERYVNDRIMSSNWPNQCKDIDEYIFKRDIANVIDEKGTAKTFEIAYLQCIKVVCELLREQSKIDTDNKDIYFSNNDNYLLAFANYQKFTLPKQLQFLNAYQYSKYEVGNESRCIYVHNNNVYKSNSIHICPYSNEELKNDIEIKVLDEDVKIMEKRLISAQQKIINIS